MYRSIFILLCLSVPIFAQLTPYQQQLLNNLEYQRQMQQQMYEQQYQRQQQTQQTQQLMMLYMLSKMAEKNKAANDDYESDDEDDSDYEDDDVSQNNSGSYVGGVDQEIRFHVDPNDRVTEEEYNSGYNQSNASSRHKGTTCYVCKGEGKKKCTFCGGDGELPPKRHYTPDYSGSGKSSYTEERRECGVCNGSGKAPCTTCGGYGSR